MKAGFLGLAMGLAVVPTMGAERVSAGRPNIIFIMSDELLGRKLALQ